MRQRDLLLSLSDQYRAFTEYPFLFTQDDVMDAGLIIVVCFDPPFHVYFTDLDNANDFNVKIIVTIKTEQCI